MIDYRLFGLRIRSDLDLPELAACLDAGEPDVTITLSNRDAERSPAGVHASDGDILFVAEDVAHYRISGGNRIQVEPALDAPDRNVRLFLLGSAFGALLHQRGLLPLHANAVEIDGRAVAFMGESGAGKSTLAAWFHDNGYPVLADDVCVISPDRHGFPVVRKGLGRLRLWKDAVERSGRSTSDYDTSFVDEAAYEKFDVPLTNAEIENRSAPAGALYVLDRSDAFEITELNGIDAVECLMANTYRGGMVGVAGASQLHWQNCVALARQVPVFRCARVWGYEHFEEQMTVLLEHARSTLERDFGR